MSSQGEATLPRDPKLADLGPLAARGGALVAAAQAAKLAAQLVTLAILARLLAPADFGLVAMATALTGFVLVFGQTGLSLATVQRPHLDDAEVSALFWVNAGIGLALTLGVFAAAPLVASFYGEPRLLGVTRGLSLGFVVGGLSVQHLALLRRRMQFGSAAAVDVAAVCFGSAAAVAAAAAGWGVFSLVVLQLASVAATTVGAWWACRWRPRAPVWNAAVASMLSFGGHHTGFGIWNYLARNLDNVLLGRLWGASPLGFYSRAYSLLTLPLNQVVAPLTQVAVPTLSRLHDDPERFRRLYLRGVRAVAYAGMPACAFLAALADDVVALVFGPGWERSAGIFRLLALAGFWQPLASTAGWVQLARGRADRMFRWSLIGGSAVMVSFVVGLPWGPEGVALSYSICVWGLALPQFRYALRGTRVTVADVLAVFARPAAVGGVVALAAIAARAAADGLAPFAALCAAAAAAASAAAVLLAAWPAGRRDAAELFATARLLGRDA